jgi:hypothetical protein
MRSQEQQSNPESFVFSPLLSCPVCCDRFSRDELAGHMDQKHPPLVLALESKEKDESSNSYFDPVQP